MPLVVPASPRGQLAFVSLMFPGGLELDAVFEDHGAHIFLVSSWTSLMCGRKGKRQRHSHIRRPWLPQSTFLPNTDPGRAQVPRHIRPLADLLAVIARLLARRQLHNEPSLHTAWTIQQLVCAEYLRTYNSHASSLDRGLRAAPFSWVNSNSRITGTLRLRHPSCSLTVRSSLLRSRPSLHCELQSQSSRSVRLISVAFWVCLALIGTR